MPSVNNIKLALLISCGVAFLFICLACGAVRPRYLRRIFAIPTFRDRPNRGNLHWGGPVCGLRRVLVCGISDLFAPTATKYSRPNSFRRGLSVLPRSRIAIGGRYPILAAPQYTGEPRCTINVPNPKRLSPPSWVDDEIRHQLESPFTPAILHHRGARHSDERCSG